MTPSTAPEPTAATALPQTLGALLAGAADAAGNPDDATEIRAIVDAMTRLLAGTPLRTDGRLTIVTLAAEAGLRRNKLTHKHTGLKDLFNALVRARHHRPHALDRLHADNARLRTENTTLRAERAALTADIARFARLVQVLGTENHRLRQTLDSGPRRLAPASEDARRTPPAS